MENNYEKQNSKISRGSGDNYNHYELLAQQLREWKVVAGSAGSLGTGNFKTLAAIKGVSCREQTILIAPDGSRHTSSTWDMLYVSQDSYRRDIYDGDFLREIQWYVPEANGTLHQSIRFDLESYFMSSGEGSFGNCDPVERMRFYVGLLNEADTLLGEQVIEGRNCVGFEIRASKCGDNPDTWVDCIWFDTETRLPVRIEECGRPVTGKSDWTFTNIKDQFDYDPQLPADTFTPWVPEDFVYGHPDDIRAAREQKQNE